LYFFYYGVIIILSRGRGNTSKKTLKKVKKPLDKPLSICYNKGTKKEQRVESQGNQKSSKKNKKVLTNKSRNAIIKM
jgi:hypothetical protein